MPKKLTDKVESISDELRKDMREDIKEKLKDKDSEESRKAMKILREVGSKWKKRLYKQLLEMAKEGKEDGSTD